MAWPQPGECPVDVEDDPALIPVSPALALLPLALAGLVCLRAPGGGRGTADRRGVERGKAA